MLEATAIISYENQKDWNRCILTHCDSNGNSTAVTILKIIDDNFNATPLNSKWTWDNGNRKDYDRGYYSFTLNPGSLTVVVSPVPNTQPLTEWWNTKDTALKIYQQVDMKDDFEAEGTMVRASSWIYQCEYQGFFLREDSDNAIIIEWNPLNKVNSWENVAGISTNHVINNYSTGQNMRFKISNKYNAIYGNEIKVYYQTGLAMQWILGNTYTGIKYKNAYLGFYCKSTTAKDTYMKVDNFIYYGAKTFTAGEIVGPVETLGGIPAGNGTIRWAQNMPLYGNPQIKLYVQTSNDGVNWPDGWGSAYTNNNGSTITATKRQYVRFKAELLTDDYNYSPELQKVEIEYPALPPIKPKIISTTNPENAWSNTKNAVFSWTGAEANGVTVNGYFMNFNNSGYLPATITAATVSVTNTVEGENTFKLIAVADAANDNLHSEESVYKFYVDLIPPGKPVKQTASHIEYEKTASNNFSIKLASVDSTENTQNVSGVAGYTFAIGKTPNAPGDIIASVDGNIKINSLENGIWFFRACALDVAGNKSDVLEYDIDIDYKGVALDEKFVKVYPTISASYIKITYQLAVNVKKVDIEIRDVSGKSIEVIQGNTMNGEFIMEKNTSGMVNGVYFVRIKALKYDGKEDVVVKKFVVKK